MAAVLSPGQVLPNELSPGEVRAPGQAQTPEEKWRADYNIKLICPECREDPPDLRDTSEGDTVCSECGLVLSARLVDSGSEWRTFANDSEGAGDDPSRVGKAQGAFDTGPELETSIAFGDGSAKARDLARSHQKATVGKDKPLADGISRVRNTCSAFGLDQAVTDCALDYYTRTYQNPQVFKGRNMESLIAGAVFLACRQRGVPRTFRDINAVTHVSKKEIGKSFKLLDAFMKEKSNQQKTGAASGLAVADNTGSVQAHQYTMQLCNKLNAGRSVAFCSTDIAMKEANLGLVAGRSPTSIAAACIYMAGYLLGKASNPKEIAIACAVSDSTIRQAYRLLYNSKEDLVDAKWLAPPNNGKLENLPVPSEVQKDKDSKMRKDADTKMTSG